MLTISNPQLFHIIMIEEDSELKLKYRYFSRNDLKIFELEHYVKLFSDLRIGI